MSTGYDVSINEEKARTWVTDVKTEISNVKTVLSKVKLECDTDVGENDSIFQMIKKTSELVGNAWQTVTQTFENAWDKLEEAIKKFGEAGKNIQNEFEDFNKKIK